MPFELPLFPLNVVLFPSMQLPLHIFEPRYQRMMQRCLDGDRTFGVALLAAGVEGESGTVPVSVGCSAKIIAVTNFPDGRMNLMTTGRRRFQILALREEDEYLVGTCEWLHDETPPAGCDELAAEVRRALHRYLLVLGRNAEISAAELADLDVPPDPYELSMWIAAFITLPNAQRQELLELTSTADRLEIERRFLLRGEVVQRAFEQKQSAEESSKSTSESADDEPPGAYSPFVSLN